MGKKFVMDENLLFDAKKIQELQEKEKQEEIKKKEDEERADIQISFNLNAL